jgi:DNA-directed RNA polymerase subunit RPC12/RpoP
VTNPAAPSPSAAEGGVTFPCSNCGAKLQFDPSAQGMVCPFCGHKEAVRAQAPAPAPAQAPSAAMQPAPSAQIRDIPLEEGMRMAARGLGVQVATIQCKDCGATVNVGQGERTAACAFCGSKQVLSLETNQSAIRPESLLPFKVTKEDASTRFTGWLGKLWFRPSNLKKLASVQELGGVYVPFWTFASNVYSQWTAERGWHYYESETYTANENGQQVTRTRQVQRTRWEPASGWRRDRYEDHQICAGKGLPGTLVAQFSKFDTRSLVPYQPEYLSGWRAESYAIDLMPAWGTASEQISNEQTGRCGRDVGGNTHRYLNASHQFSSITFKHILLPIWIAAYRYNQKVYRFLVNGQTGEVVGEAPWSAWKIMALVVSIALVIGAIVFAYIRLNPPQTPEPTPTMTAAPVMTAAPPHPGAAAQPTTTPAPGAVHPLHGPTTAPTTAPTATGFKPIGPGHPQH